MISTQNKNNPIPAPSSTEVKLSDVIKLILQFLQQNNLHQSFQTLQRQSKTCLNFADRSVVQEIISNSNWQRMFKLLNEVTLSQETLFDLYELIVDDLIDKDAFEAAKFVLNQCINSSDIYGNFTVNKSIIEQNKQKILRLQYICQNPSQKAMYHRPPTPIRRQSITSRIIKQTHQQVQKSRLLTLITSALKYESSKGLIMPNLTYSLIDGKYKNIQNQMEQMITKVDKILRYNQQTRITAVKMSNKGQFIALGGIDGLIQIYQPIQYTLDTSTLKYQGQGIMLYHDNSIQHIIFNQTDEILATTDNKNTIKIWNTYTGRLLRKIDHNSTIGCICWGIDSSQLAVGYQNVQVYGVRGCNLLKEYVCGRESNNISQQYLMDLAVCSNNMSGNRVYTFGQTGTIRVFNFKTQQQTGSININKNILNPNGIATGDMIKIILTKNRDSQQTFHICTNKYVICINEKLEQVSKYEVNGSGDSVQLVNIVISNNFIYECIKKNKGILKQKSNNNDGQHVIQVRDSKTHRILYSKQIESKINIMQLHKHRNLLLTYGVDEVLSFWRP